MVPAVTVICVSVVSVVSIRVAVPMCTGSYRVGVVIVVCSSFPLRKFSKGSVSVKRLMLRSPCRVMDVFGYFVCIASIAVCRFLMMSGSVRGLLYRHMRVCIGLFFCLVLWMWRIIVAIFGIFMSSVIVVRRLFLTYMVTSFRCVCV